MVKAILIKQSLPRNIQLIGIEDEPYYPVNNQVNNGLYKQYAQLAAETKPNIIFGGRLGQYRYYNMDQVIHAALIAIEREFDTKN